MKVIEIEEWKDKWPMKCAYMTANMRDYDNPNYQDVQYNRVREGNTIPNEPETKRFTNHTINYSWTAHAMGIPLTFAKGSTLVTIATECTHCRIKGVICVNHKTEFNTESEPSDRKTQRVNNEYKFQHGGVSCSWACVFLSLRMCQTHTAG